MTTVDAFPETRVDPTVDLDQRFTLRETDDLGRKLARVKKWDLDVAACEESHLAETYYTQPQNGLVQPWFGNVWCNPPYSDVEAWVKRAWQEMFREGGPALVAMLLPSNRTEQPWWQQGIEPLRDGRADRLDMLMRFGSAPWLETHFLPTRIKFGHPGNRDGGGVGSPPFGCVLLVWRRE